MLSGTRNNDDSCEPVGDQIKQRRVKSATYRRTVLVADQRPAERALHGIVHPNTRLECTECPEAHVLIRRRDARRKRERARRAHQRAQLCV